MIEIEKRNLKGSPHENGKLKVTKLCKNIIFIFFTIQNKGWSINDVTHIFRVSI